MLRGAFIAKYKEINLLDSGLSHMKACSSSSSTEEDEIDVTKLPNDGIKQAEHQHLINSADVTRLKVRTLV